MTAQSRQLLELFVRLAENLRDSAYTQHMEATGGASVRFTFNTGLDGSEPRTELSHNYPAEDPTILMAVKARQFIQRNDPISLAKLGILLEDPGISNEFKGRLAELKKGMGEFLDAKSMMKDAWTDGREKHYTNREVFDIFVNGSYAHSDPKFAEILARWSQMGLAYIMLQQSFHMTVNRIIHGVSYLYGYTLLELKGEPVPPVVLPLDP